MQSQPYSCPRLRPRSEGVTVIQKYTASHLTRSLGAFAICLFLLSTDDVSAGNLDSFESSATQKTHNTDTRKEKDSDSFASDLLGEIFGGIIESGIVCGGASSLERVGSLSSDDDFVELKPRKMGELLIPFTRVDVSYQDVESDVDAYDYRVEFGYGPVGLHFNQTHYREADPKDDLDLIRLYGLYRMSFGSSVEMDLGLGALTIDGNDRNSSFSLTLPILIHPSDRIGIEFRPTWAANISDYDIGLLATWHYTSIKIGYRWVRSPSESLDGPYAGLSVHF